MGIMGIYHSCAVISKLHFIDDIIVFADFSYDPADGELVFINDIILPSEVWAHRLDYDREIGLRGDSIVVDAGTIIRWIKHE